MTHSRETQWGCQAMGNRHLSSVATNFVKTLLEVKLPWSWRLPRSTTERERETHQGFVGICKGVIIIMEYVLFMEKGQT